VSIFPTDYSVGPGEFARMVEERGFESLFYPEHTHIPASRRTPYPAGGELPREYSHLLDPFLALTAAAAVTDDLLLGTGISLVIERDPIVTAKEVATLDQISGGRFLFGVGACWNLEEMENHGTRPDKRFSLLRERVLAMREIWTKDEAEYHGEFVDFGPIWSWPKPVQDPHPPVMIGGNSPGALARVVEFGDEWLPNPSTRLNKLPDAIADLERLAAEAGRDRIPITFYAPQPEVDKLARFAAAGVDRCVFLLPPASAEEIEPILDWHAELCKSFSS
jgi:probable F420-dependent oxidoreductase